MLVKNTYDLAGSQHIREQPTRMVGDAEAREDGAAHMLGVIRSERSPAVDRDLPAVHVEGRKFMVGQALTLADFDIAGPFSQIDRSKPPLRDYPNLMAWHDNLLQSVPEWAETKAEVDNRIDSFLASVGVKL